MVKQYDKLENVMKASTTTPTVKWYYERRCKFCKKIT